MGLGLASAGTAKIHAPVQHIPATQAQGPIKGLLSGRVLTGVTICLKHVRLLPPLHSFTFAHSVQRCSALQWGCMDKLHWKICLGKPFPHHY